MFNECIMYSQCLISSYVPVFSPQATLNDLIILGFIPKEIGEDPRKAALVAPLIGTVLEQLSGGGGAKAITIESVGEEIETLGKQYPIVSEWRARGSRAVPLCARRRRR
jgi:hypothetical protein